MYFVQVFFFCFFLNIHQEVSKRTQQQLTPKSLAHKSSGTDINTSHQNNTQLDEKRTKMKSIWQKQNE